MIIDTHAHLNLDPLKGNLDNVIRNAKESNIAGIVTVCTSLEDYQDLKLISNKYDMVFNSIGVHPCNVTAQNITSTKTLCELADSFIKTVAFGETGLDYYHSNENIEAQKESFINHIKAASMLKLPVIVHTRSAEEDTISILKSEMKVNNYSGIIHCFTASYEFAKQALDLGLYISIAGIVTFKNATVLQEIIKKLPLDRLLVETDSPYLAPVPMRGKSNEPAFTAHTAKFLASLLGIDQQYLIETTTMNAKKVFTKAKFNC